MEHIESHTAVLVALVLGSAGDLTRVKRHDGKPFQSRSSGGQERDSCDELHIDDNGDQMRKVADELDQ